MDVDAMITQAREQAGLDSFGEHDPVPALTMLFVTVVSYMAPAYRPCWPIMCTNLF